MPVSQIRGSTQIIDASITAAKFAASLNLPLSQIAGGTGLIKADGTVAFTAAQSMGNQLLTNVADAVSAQDAVNLRTLQTFINGFGTSKRARTIFTTNVALTGLQNTDGVTGVAGDIVWLNGQTTASQNGLWTMNAGAWTRPFNWAAASTQKSFQLFIEEGTVNHDTKWLVAADAMVVDTTAVTAVQDTSGGTYTNGNGLSLTGNVFAVKLLSTGGLSFDGGGNVQIALNGSSLNLSASGLKIADSTSGGQILLGNASNAATWTTVSGDFALSNTGVATAAATIMKSANYVVNEVPAGTINGVNAGFTLAATPLAGKEMIYLNGVLQEGGGNDYTLSGATVTMVSAPLSGDKVRATYLK